MTTITKHVTKANFDMILAANFKGNLYIGYGKVTDFVMIIVECPRKSEYVDPHGNIQ